MKNLHSENCEICRILQSKNDELIVLETPHWRVTLTSDQYYLGRAYVTAKQHVPSLSGLTHESWLDLHEVIRVYEAAAVFGLGARHVTWTALMNNAYRDKNPTPHVHWHVRPRYSQIVEIGGIVFNDREFGSHHQRDKKRIVDPLILDEIAGRLRAQIAM